MGKISIWKNYNVRVGLKEGKNLSDLQLLIFVDDKVMFSSKKKSLYIREYKYQDLVLNKYYLPVFVDNIQVKLQWKDMKEKVRFMNFCSNFKRRICLQIQDDVRVLFSNYGKNYKKTS